MNGFVFVQFREQLQQLIGRHIGGQAMKLAIDADGLARTALISDVDLARGIIAYEHRSQTWHNAIVLDEFDNFFGKFGSDLLSKLLAVEEGGRHVKILAIGDSTLRDATRRV